MITLYLFIGAIAATFVYLFIVRPYLRRLPKGWSIGPVINGKNYSAGVTFDGKGFDFPYPTKEQGHVHALLYGGAKPTQSIALTYRVTASEGVTFHPQEHPEATGEISLMIQRKGDDYQAKGERIFYRLYAPGPRVIKAGEYTLTADLTNLTGWIGIFGEQPSPAQMQNVIDNLEAIHVCFGGKGGRAHGVFASGPARFELLELRT